jgi:hypothetical protein
MMITAFRKINRFKFPSISVTATNKII